MLTERWDRDRAPCSRPPESRPCSSRVRSRRPRPGAHAPSNSRRARCRRSRSVSAPTTLTSRQVVAEADLIFEAVAEDIEVKKQVFALIDKRAKAPGAIVATVSSGLSIAADVRRPQRGVQASTSSASTCSTRRRSSRAPRSFRTRETDRGVVELMRHVLEATFGRVVDRVRRHAGVRGQSHRLQAAQRGRAARRRARRRVHGSARRYAHRPRARRRSRRSISSAGTSTRRSSTTCTRTRATKRTRTSRCRRTWQRGIERGHLGRKTQRQGRLLPHGRQRRRREALRARSGDRRLPPARRGEAADAGVHRAHEGRDQERQPSRSVRRAVPRRRQGRRRCSAA